MVQLPTGLFQAAQEFPELDYGYDHVALELVLDVDCFAVDGLLRVEGDVQITAITRKTPSETERCLRVEGIANNFEGRVSD